MTTPERLRRRQRRNDWFIALLAMALVGSVVMYRVREAQDDRCFRSYLSNQAETSQIGRALVQRESRITRHALHGAGKVTTRAEFDALLHEYDRKWLHINQERKDHPIKPFDPESC